MKKLVLLVAVLSTITTQAQITTGEVIFSAGFSAQVDVDDTAVTLTMIGPDDIWLGVGFGVSSMTTGGDIVSYDSSGFNDRRFIGVGGTPPTDTQDWTVVSNEVTGGERTIVASRALEGSDDTDYIFSPDDSSLMLVWARGNSLTFGNHGSGNRGATAVGFNLGVQEDTFSQTVTLFPNPTRDIINVSFLHSGDKAQIEIYSILGQTVRSESLTAQEAIYDISDLKTGVYVLKIITDSGVASKRIVKQ